MPALNSSRSIVNMLTAMYELTEQYRKENSVLREMLLRRGLKRQELRKELNELLGVQNHDGLSTANFQNWLTE